MRTNCACTFDHKTFKNIYLHWYVTNKFNLTWGWARVYRRLLLFKYWTGLSDLHSSFCNHQCSFRDGQWMRRSFLMTNVVQPFVFWYTSENETVKSGATWARIFKLLRRPRIDSKKPIPPAYVVGGPVRHPIPTRFLAPIDCIKIPALKSTSDQKPEVGCTVYTYTERPKKHSLSVGSHSIVY